MNVLIAYFSYTGHTKGIAQQIRDITGGTLFEIRPATPYDQDYNSTERQGYRETRDGYRPPLAEQADLNLSICNTILLGTPNWFNTVAPPVATFLMGNDFTGKIMIPFVTNGGGGLGHIPADIKALAKGAKVLDSLNIYEDGGPDAKNKVMNWLKKSGL